MWVKRNIPMKYSIQKPMLKKLRFGKSGWWVGGGDSHYCIVSYPHTTAPAGPLPKYLR